MLVEPVTDSSWSHGGCRQHLITCATDRSTRSDFDRSFPAFVAAADDDDDGAEDELDSSVSGISSARGTLTTDGLLVLAPSGPMSSLGNAELLYFGDDFVIDELSSGSI